MIRLPENINEEVDLALAKAIKATALKRPFGYKGALKIHTETGLIYTKMVGPTRLDRIDALDDARRARDDYLSIRQLP